jgi:hypothetical protein
LSPESKGCSEISERSLPIPKGNLPVNTKNKRCNRIFTLEIYLSTEKLIKLHQKIFIFQVACLSTNKYSTGLNFFGERKTPHL